MPGIDNSLNAEQTSTIEDTRLLAPTRSTSSSRRAFDFQSVAGPHDDCTRPGTLIASLHPSSAASPRNVVRGRQHSRASSAAVFVLVVAKPGLNHSHTSPKKLAAGIVTLWQLNQWIRVANTDHAASEIDTTPS